MTIDQPGRAVCAEGNPWNPDFTCAKDAGHDGDHWSPTGPVTSSAQTPEPTDEQTAAATALVVDWGSDDLSPGRLRNMVARALAAAVTAERDKYLRVAETLTDMGESGNWDDATASGFRYGARRIREVSR